MRACECHHHAMRDLQNIGTKQTQQAILNHAPLLPQLAHVFPQLILRGFEHRRRYHVTHFPVHFGKVGHNFRQLLLQTLNLCVRTQKHVSARYCPPSIDALMKRTGIPSPTFSQQIVVREGQKGAHVYHLSLQQLNSVNRLGREFMQTRNLVLGLLQ